MFFLFNLMKYYNFVKILISMDNQNDNSYINNERNGTHREIVVIEESIRLNSIKEENMSTSIII